MSSGGRSCRQNVKRLPYLELKQGDRIGVLRETRERKGEGERQSNECTR